MPYDEMVERKIKWTAADDGISNKVIAEDFSFDLITL